MENQEEEKRRPLTQEEQERVVQNRSHVREIARMIHRRLPPGAVQLEDLIQEGYEGLCKAAQDYQRMDGAEFPSYASDRIRGSINDYLIQNDKASRRARQIYKDAVKMAAEGGRDGKPGLSFEAAVDRVGAVGRGNNKDVLRAVKEMKGGKKSVALEDVLHLADDRPTPEAIIATLQEGTRNRERLCTAMLTLSPKERQILEVYYGDEKKSLQEVAAELGLKEGRAAMGHIHRRALKKLQTALSGEQDNAASR